MCVWCVCVCVCVCVSNLIKYFTDKFDSVERPDPENNTLKVAGTEESHTNYGASSHFISDMKLNVVTSFTGVPLVTSDV